MSGKTFILVLQDSVSSTGKTISDMCWKGEYNYTYWFCVPCLLLQYSYEVNKLK